MIATRASVSLGSLSARARELRFSLCPAEMFEYRPVWAATPFLWWHRILQIDSPVPFLTLSVVLGSSAAAGDADSPRARQGVGERPVLVLRCVLVPEC